MQTKQVQTNSEIKDLALSQLKGRWNGPVITSLVYIIITSVINYIPIPGTTINPFSDSFLWGGGIELPILSTLLSGAFSIGLCYYFLSFVRNQDPKIEDIFEGFKQFGQSVIAAILISIIVLVGFMFLIVPWIIASLGLSQTFISCQIIQGISGIDAMKQSWEITNGYKWQLFLLGLGFIPWVFLCIFTLFIGLLWLMPYMYVSFSNFYLQLKNEEQEFNIDDHLIA